MAWGIIADALQGLLNSFVWPVTVFWRLICTATGGRRGDVPSFQSFLDEADVLLNQAQERFADVPLFLYGHSLGGCVALSYVLSRAAVQRWSHFSAFALAAGCMHYCQRPLVIYYRVSLLNNMK